MSANLKWYLPLMITAGILTGCAGTSRQALYREDDETSFSRLPGVDSLVVVQALVLADSAFVSEEREAEAEKFLKIGKREFTVSDTLHSLKKILDTARDTTVPVTGEDSTKAIAYLNQAFGHYQEVDNLFNRYLEKENSTETLGETILDRLTTARDATIQSIRYNPFDMDARLLLSVIYRYMARVLGSEEHYREAIRVLNELIEMDRGDHSLFYELGFNHYQIENWEVALDAFRRAEELLYESAALEGRETGVAGETATTSETDDSTAPGGEKPVESVEKDTVDTATILNYVWFQADCLTRLHRSEEALLSYTRALSLASSEEEREELQGSIDWILWDNGNIRNVEARDSLIHLEREKDYRAVRRGYLKLLSALTKATAIDEVDWRIATIDYQFLGDKDAGIERLRRLIDRAIGQGVVSREGIASDPSSPYLDYVNDYGIMCFNLGIDYLTEKKRRKEAFAYFLQASRFEWENRGSSFVELLKLASNNPNMTITYGEKALENSLLREDRIYVLKQLTTAYKRKGSRADFEKARHYFNEWKKLSKRQN